MDTRPDPGMDEVVSDFYAAVLADPMLAPFFARTDMDHLRSMQREHLAAAFGGPERFGPSELRAAHAGRGIRPQHLSRFVELFVDAMRSHGLSEDDVDRVVGRLSVAVADIVSETSEDG